MTDIPRTAHEVVLALLARPVGMRVLDIGCGKSGLRRRLTDAGMIWRGIDPFAPAAPDIDIAPAQDMPYPDQSFDAAIYINALHHVPVDQMGPALSETARVLVPGGRLIVIEPEATGALSQVIAVVDDETVIRAAAQMALDVAPNTTALRQTDDFGYARTETYIDFNAFCAQIATVAPERAEMIAQRQEALAHKFHAHAGRTDKGYTLDQPMRVRVFTRT